MRNQISRRYLVEMLEYLQTDEFDSFEVVYMTEEEIIMAIINTAKYYKESSEELDK